VARQGQGPRGTISGAGRPPPRYRLPWLQRTLTLLLGLLSGVDSMKVQSKLFAAQRQPCSFVCARTRWRLSLRGVGT